MISLVHHLPAAIIHSLLLQLKLSVPLPNGQAVGHRTILSLALPGVYLQQGPNTLADVASPIGLNFAASTVFEQSLHLGTVGRRALS